MISSKRLKVSGGGCRSAMTKVESRLSATHLMSLIISKVVAESNPLDIASMNFIGLGLHIISPVCSGRIGKVGVRWDRMKDGMRWDEKWNIK